MFVHNKYFEATFCIAGFLFLMSVAWHQNSHSAQSALVSWMFGFFCFCFLLIFTGRPYPETTLRRGILQKDLGPGTWRNLAFWQKWEILGTEKERIYKKFYANCPENISHTVSHQYRGQDCDLILTVEFQQDKDFTHWFFENYIYEKNVDFPTAVKSFFETTPRVVTDHMAQFPDRDNGRVRFEYNPETRDHVYVVWQLVLPVKNTTDE